MIEVKAIDSAAQEGAWEDFLVGTPGALVYHSIRYRNLLVDHLGCDAEYLMALEGGEIRGVLPLMWSGEDGARICNSLPFYGSHGGPVATAPEFEEELLEAWNERVTDASTLAGTMVANPFLDRAAPLPAHTMTDERISQITELPDQAVEDEIMALIRPEARRNVRTALRLGVSVELDNGDAALAELNRIHQENMRAIGGLAKSEDFFEAIPRHLRAEDDFDVWIARLDGEPLAALLVLRYNGVAEYFTSGTRLEHRGDNPHSALLVAAMSHAARRGCRRWNWGGTWVGQTGVYRFKRKWGAQETRYRYFVQINDKALLDATPDQLLKRFPNFYVAPFSALRSAEQAEAGELS